MSEFVTDRTLIGLGATVISVGIALWRRLSSSRPGSQPLYVRLARLGSAVWKQQAAEGALDTYRESLLLEREERELWHTRYREVMAENATLRAEITTLRDEPAPPTTSATSPSSAASSGGSTGLRKARTRKKPTT